MGTGGCAMDCFGCVWGLVGVSLAHWCQNLWAVSAFFLCLCFFLLILVGVELPLRVAVTILECCVTFSGVKLSIRSFVLFRELLMRLCSVLLSYFLTTAVSGVVCWGWTNCNTGTYQAHFGFFFLSVEEVGNYSIAILNRRSTHGFSVLRLI